LDLENDPLAETVTEFDMLNVSVSLWDVVVLAEYVGLDVMEGVPWDCVDDAVTVGIVELASRVRECFVPVSDDVTVIPGLMRPERVWEIAERLEEGVSDSVGDAVTEPRE
jgi:hypothetical protein